MNRPPVEFRIALVWFWFAIMQYGTDDDPGWPEVEE